MAKIFLDGIRADQPPEKAPDWVVAKISIDFQKFIKSAESHVSPKGWLTLDVLKSKKDTYYIALNEWQPLAKPAFVKEKEEAVQDLGGDRLDYPGEEINADDIPF